MASVTSKHTTASSSRNMGEDVEKMGRANVPTPTKTDMCTSFSSFFPVSFASDVFTSQPVTTEAKAASVGITNSLPSPPSPPPLASLASQSGVLYSTDSGEVVGTVPSLKLNDTDSTESDDDKDDYAATGARTRARKRSILKSIECIATLAVLMIASVTFLASLFIFYPKRGSGGPNVNYTFEDDYNESGNATNATQIETEEEDTFSTVIVTGTLSPSPTLSPTSLEPTSLETGSPSVSPSRYPPTYPPSPKIVSMALEAVEDTFIMAGETQKLGKGEGQTFGRESYLRIRGGDAATMITIIRFDTTPLIELGATVVSAKLSLFARTDSVFGGQINVASDDCEWNEKDTSWANAPDCILETGVDTSGLLDGWMGSDLLGWIGVVSDPLEWYEADLEWQPKQIPSQLTLIISSDNEDGVTYSSRNNDKDESSKPPTVTVEYLVARQ
eukprot:scaffold9407_cov74-Skeletonema_dohrnii-CCMP3373.AAC.2